jgi:phosphoglycerol transferase MdoB-like AlkP superfamily enzyme
MIQNLIKEIKMNKFDKIRAFCRPFRILIGVVLIAIGIITSNAWFYLGVIPLIAGLVDFCPTCIISKKCTVK